MKKKTKYILGGVLVVFLLVLTVFLAMGIKESVPQSDSGCIEAKRPGGGEICLPEMSLYSVSAPALTLATAQEMPKFEPGTTVSKTLSVSGTATIDEDYSDGDVTYVHGKWAIYKGGTEVTSGSWEKLNSPSYSHTFSKSFSADDIGKYSYVVVLTKSENTYTSSGWGDYTVTELDKDSYTFQIGAPKPPGPLEKLQQFFQGIVNWISGLF